MMLGDMAPPWRSAGSYTDSIILLKASDGQGKIYGFSFVLADLNSSLLSW